jgi:midasin
MIDNSSSMVTSGPLALDAAALISTALKRLEIGDLSIVSFAENVNIVHPFGKPFDDNAGARVISHFDFNSQRTNLGLGLETIFPLMIDAKDRSESSRLGSTMSVVLQLLFVISDAKIDSENRANLDLVIRNYSEQNIFVVLIIIDQTADPKDSIFNTKSIEFHNDKILTKRYLDDFPFPYYIAISDLDTLPEVLCDALKEWFQIINSQLTSL